MFTVISLILGFAVLKVVFRLIGAAFKLSVFLLKLTFIPALIVIGVLSFLTLELSIALPIVLVLAVVGICEVVKK